MSAPKLTLTCTFSFAFRIVRPCSLPGSQSIVNVVIIVYVSFKIYQDRMHVYYILIKRVQQYERSPRARCTGTYLYTWYVKPGTSKTRSRRALTLLNAPLEYALCKNLCWWRTICRKLNRHVINKTDHRVCPRGTDLPQVWDPSQFWPIVRETIFSSFFFFSSFSMNISKNVMSPKKVFFTLAGASRMEHRLPHSRLYHWHSVNDSYLLREKIIFI